MNIVAHVEIPVTDLDRAIRFYRAVLMCHLPKSSRSTIAEWPISL